MEIQQPTKQSKFKKFVALGLMAVAVAGYVNHHNNVMAQDAEQAVQAQQHQVMCEGLLAQHADIKAQGNSLDSNSIDFKLNATYLKNSMKKLERNDCLIKLPKSLATPG